MSATHKIMQDSTIGNVENYYAIDECVDFMLLRIGNCAFSVHITNFR